jgi:hypothetical protein
MERRLQQFCARPRLWDSRPLSRENLADVQQLPFGITPLGCGDAAGPCVGTMVAGKSGLRPFAAALRVAVIVPAEP